MEHILSGWLGAARHSSWILRMRIYQIPSRDFLVVCIFNTYLVLDYGYLFLIGLACLFLRIKKSKAVPLHAMVALGGEEV
jgi:hypothetical protein